MSVSVSMEDEDVLQLLTGEDEFDADIDEMAEEELLRDDIVTTDINKSQTNQNQNNVSLNKSMDDEEEEDERDSHSRGRFRSERIMSLASVPTRRREIPDSLESINVKIDKNNEKSHYNRRNNSQQKYRHFKQNLSNGSQNQRQNNFRANKGLLPLPNQPIGQVSQPHQRMVLIHQNFYGQQMPNNSNPMNTIHVNPHFRARVPNYDPMAQGVRQGLTLQSTDTHSRLPSNAFQAPPHFPQQTVNNSQQMLFNQQMNPHFRPHCMSTNHMFNEQNRPQMAPPLQPPLQSSQQQSVIHQTQPHHQIGMENQWRHSSVATQFQMHPNLGQPLVPQQMAVNRPMNANPMLSGTTQNFNVGYEPFPTYQSNQTLLMTPTGNQSSFPVQNNMSHTFQPIVNQRYPIHQNFQNRFGSQQQHFQNTNQQMIPNNSMNQMTHQKPSIVMNRNDIQFDNNQRPYKPIVGNNEQKSDVIKAAQMRTKRAKQLLTKKQQNVKEVQIVKNVLTHTSNSVSQIQNKVIEDEVGVDEEYKKKLEQQKYLREQVLRNKEERRKAMAAQRLKESELKSGLQTNKTLELKKSPVRSQPQQQIATLLNRSPQPTGASKPVVKRMVKPITSDKTKPMINRLVVVNVNQNQKRSVLIKGLAASTTEMALRKLCKPIGAIESCKICVTGGQKTATVTFVRSQDAIQFQSKYERTLLDLSIIQVSLIWFVFHYFSPVGGIFLYDHQFLIY